MRRSTFRTLIGLSALTASVMLTSCGSEKAETTETTAPSVAQPDSMPKAPSAADDFFARIPTASAVPALLERSGAEYNKMLVNKAGKATTYSTSAAKAAINLGVYGADMAYLCAYEKNKEAQAYIKDIQKLAEHLNANDAFGAAMLERMKKNMENNDSLMALTDEGIKLANSLLKQSERKADAFLIGAGGFIEGLYLATGLVETFPKDMKPADRDLVLMPLTRTIVDQKKPLTDLVEIGKDVPSGPEVDALKVELAALLDIYNKLNIDEQIKANKGEMILGDATLHAISEKVKTTRTSLIK